MNFEQPMNTIFLSKQTNKPITKIVTNIYLSVVSFIQQQTLKISQFIQLTDPFKLIKFIVKRDQQIMNCCCQQQQSTLTERSCRDESDNYMKNTTPKLKYSFRTQQATSSTNRQANSNINTYTTTHSHLFYSTHPPIDSKLLQSATTSNQLIELQRQRQSLIIQDRQLDAFYQQKIVPLEKEVQFYQHQVKVRSIEIMELESLLGKKVQERIDIEGKRNTSEQYHPHGESVLTSQVNNSQPVIYTLRPSQPVLLSEAPSQQVPPQHIILAPQHQPVIISSPLSPRQSIVVSQFIMRPQPQPVGI